MYRYVCKYVCMQGYMCIRMNIYIYIYVRSNEFACVFIYTDSGSLRGHHAQGHPLGEIDIGASLDK